MEKEIYFISRRWETISKLSEIKPVVGPSLDNLANNLQSEFSHHNLLIVPQNSGDIVGRLGFKIDSEIITGQVNAYCQGNKSSGFQPILEASVFYNQSLENSTIDEYNKLSRMIEVGVRGKSYLPRILQESNRKPNDRSFSIFSVISHYLENF